MKTDTTQWPVATHYGITITATNAVNDIVVSLAGGNTGRVLATYQRAYEAMQEQASGAYDSDYSYLEAGPIKFGHVVGIRDDNDDLIVIGVYLKAVPPIFAITLPAPTNDVDHYVLAVNRHPMVTMSGTFYRAEVVRTAQVWTSC